MKKNMFCIVVGILALSIFLCSGVFAQEPDIEALGDDLTSLGDIVNQVKNEFNAYANQISDFAQTYLPLEMKTKVDTMLGEIQTKLGTLLKVDVYVSDSDYDTVHGKYVTEYGNDFLDDVSTAEFQAFLEQKKEQVKGAVADQQIPQPPQISDATLERLKQLNDIGELKATRGKRGKSRVSILSVYIHPVDHTLIEKTTIVISTFSVPQ